MKAETGSRIGAALVWGTFVIGIASVFLISPEDERIRALLESLGAFGSLAYFVAEVVQVVVIPIPGQPFEVAGGWLLGLVGGSLVGSFGAIVGSMVAFRIARRFGRDWVARHVSGGALKRVTDGLKEGKRAEWIVFWLMMVPNFPRDPLCYVAGISGMSHRSFLLIAVLGRPVGLVPWVALGAQGAASGIAWQLAMIAVAAGIWIVMRFAPRLVRGAPETTEPELEPES